MMIITTESAKKKKDQVQVSIKNVFGRCPFYISNFGKNHNQSKGIWFARFIHIVKRKKRGFCREMAGRSERGIRKL